MFNYKDALQKTQLVLASRGNKTPLVEKRQRIASQERAAGSVQLNPEDFFDENKLWELKTELEQSSTDFLEGFAAQNPEIMVRIQTLSFTKRAQARAKAGNLETIKYRSVLPGRGARPLQYFGGLICEASPSRAMSTEEAMNKLKQHHNEYWAELKMRDRFIISLERMYDLNWYPSVEHSILEQFEEYRKIFIAPERARRETRMQEIHWELKWYAEQFSEKKKYCSTIRWRNKNIFSRNRLIKRYRKKKWKFWCRIGSYYLRYSP